MSEHLIELVYSRYSSHYSKRNWFCNEPNYAQLSEEDKEFWKTLVQLIADQTITDRE